MENSAFKLSGLFLLLLGLGYKIGNSSSDELKESIDKIIDYVEEYGEKAVTMIKDFIDNSENISSDEIKANIEKFVSTLMKRVDEIE
jgi:L-cysteine desulfidase